MNTLIFIELYCRIYNLSQIVKYDYKFILIYMKYLSFKKNQIE